MLVFLTPPVFPLTELLLLSLCQAYEISLPLIMMLEIQTFFSLLETVSKKSAVSPSSMYETDCAL